MRLMIPFVVVALLIFSPSAFAQSAVGSLAALESRLPVGTAVVVTERGGTQVRGTVRGIAPDGLVLLVRRAVKRYAESDLALIEMRQTDNLLDGTVYGASIGAGLGLVLYVAACGFDRCDGIGQVFAGYVFTGSVIGLCVDAAVRPLRPVYISGLKTASAHSRSWGIAPIVASNAKGAVLSLTF